MTNNHNERIVRCKLLLEEVANLIDLTLAQDGIAFYIKGAVDSLGAYKACVEQQMLIFQLENRGK